MSDFTAARDQIIAQAGGTVHVHGVDADALAERDAALVARIVAAFDATPAATAAHDAGVSDDRVIALARRIAADVPDLDAAFAELERAVEVAIEDQVRGAAGSNTGHFVDAVLARMAELSAENRDDEAAAEADRAFAEWEERQRLETQKGIALLEAGLRADILRRDPASAARRIARKLELEAPDPGRFFDDLRDEQATWHQRGRDQGLNFDLEVSIELAHAAQSRARNADERGRALNNLGIALRRSGSARAARRGWRRRSPPTAPRWRSGPASACRSTGR